MDGLRQNKPPSRAELEVRAIFDSLCSEVRAKRSGRCTHTLLNPSPQAHLTGACWTSFSKYVKVMKMHLEFFLFPWLKQSVLSFCTRLSIVCVYVC